MFGDEGWEALVIKEELHINVQNLNFVLMQKCETKQLDITTISPKFEYYRLRHLCKFLPIL
jgi:hypothetical protein